MQEYLNDLSKDPRFSLPAPGGSLAKSHWPLNKTRLPQTAALQLKPCGTPLPPKGTSIFTPY